MATGILSSFAERSSSVDEEGSYIPQRSPPPIPTVAYSSLTPAKPPVLGSRPIGLQQRQQQYAQAQAQSQQQQQQQQQQQSFSGTTSTTSTSTSEGVRRGSFSFLRKTSSSQQHTLTAAAAINNSSISSSNNGPAPFRTLSHEDQKPRMLRKASRARAEQERVQRDHDTAAASARAEREPPRLPSHNPLPNIATFGGDEARPDSVAIFNNSYTDPNTPPAIPQSQGGTNFSRPGNAFAAMASTPPHNPSSSPTYALRGQGTPVTVNSSPANTSELYDAAGGRTSSMTNRGRYSYASTAANPSGGVNSPRRVRRRKDPTPFNVLVIGTKNSGKTSFISFLKQSLALPANKQDPADTQHSSSKGAFKSDYLETEIEGERVGLTLWDSIGLEKGVVDLQLREMTAFIEARFEETFTEEQKVMRSPGFKDTHIHCVFLILDPVRLDNTVAASLGPKSTTGLEGLDEEVDLQVLKALWGKTTVIPVISKADTITMGHMAHLKKAVWGSVKNAKMNPLEALELEDDDDLEEEDEEEEDDSELSSPTGDSVIDNILNESSEEDAKPKRASVHIRQASTNLNNGSLDDEPYIPMSILSPDPYDLPPYTKHAPKSQAEIGRRFAWGLASPFNPEHCDFIRLRDTIFSEWRADLRDLSRVRWYEHWRTSRLRNVPGTKQRIKGGVTPLGSVPREGRMSPMSVRNFSGPGSGYPPPRSVSQPTSGPVSTAVASY